jgi:hypothetical protein
MKKYMKSKKKLTKLNIPYFESFEVTDEALIKKYTELVLFDKELPGAITKEDIEVVDVEEVKTLHNLVKEGEPLPKGIVAKKYQSDTDTVFNKYFYNNKFKFIEKVYLEEDEVDFNLQVKQTEHLESIAKTMFFFKVLAWIGIISSIIIAILILVNANG